MATTVAIVEDDAEICEHLEQVLAGSRSFESIGVCRNARTALTRIPLLEPEMVIMDINLPDISGIECTAKLKSVLPNLHVVIFSVHEDNDAIFRALQAGAAGYILKRAKTAELLAALEQVRTGGGAMSGDIALRVMRTFQKPTPAPAASALTQREEEVLQLLAKGLLSKEIASQLSISLATVNGHLRNIYEKLHVRTRTEAVLKYLG